MRFFHVASGNGAVAVICHNYLDGQYYCRTGSDAFRRAFNEVCGRVLNRFTRANRNLYLHPYSPHDHGWMSTVLDEVCRGDWVYEELDPKEVGSFDDLVGERLAR